MTEQLTVTIPVPASVFNDSDFDVDEYLTTLRDQAVTRRLKDSDMCLVDGGPVTREVLRNQSVCDERGQVIYNLRDMDLVAVRYTFEAEAA